MRKFLLSLFALTLLVSCKGKENSEHLTVTAGNSILILNTLSEDISLYRGGRILNHLSPADQGANKIIIDEKGITVINSLSNSLTTYDFQLHLLSETSTGSGTNPFSGAELGGILYVSLYLKDQIALFSRSGDSWKFKYSVEITGELPADTPGEKRRFSPMGVCRCCGRVFVALANLNSSSTAGGPGGIYMGKENEWSLIQVNGRDTVNVVNIGGRIAVISAGDYRNGEGFAGNGKIEIYHPEKSIFITEVDVPGAPYTVTGPINSRYFVSDASMGKVLVYDSEWKLVDKIILSNNSLSMVSDLESFGNLLFAAEFNTSQLFVIDPVKLKIIGRYKTGEGPVDLQKVKGGVE